MLEPTREEIERALALVGIPRSMRTDDEEQFLARFWTDYLQPREDEDPTKLAARLYGDLGQIRVRLVHQGYESHYAVVPPDPPPVPRPPRTDVEPARSRKKSKRRRQRAPEIPASTGPQRTGAGSVLGTLLGTSHEPTDEQIGAFLSARSRSHEWVQRAGWWSAAALAGVLLLAITLAARTVWLAKHAAEHQGSNVQQRQGEVGNFSDQIPTNPHRAPVPGGQPSAASSPQR